MMMLESDSNSLSLRYRCWLYLAAWGCATLFAAVDIVLLPQTDIRYLKIVPFMPLLLPALFAKALSLPHHASMKLIVVVYGLFCVHAFFLLRATRKLLFTCLYLLLIATIVIGVHHFHGILDGRYKSRQGRRIVSDKEQLKQALEQWRLEQAGNSNSPTDLHPLAGQNLG